MLYNEQSRIRPRNPGYTRTSDFPCWEQRPGTNTMPLSALLQNLSDLSEGGSLFEIIYQCKDLNQQNMCVMIRRNLLTKRVILDLPISKVSLQKQTSLRLIWIKFLF